MSHQRSTQINYCAPMMTEQGEDEGFRCFGGERNTLKNDAVLVRGASADTCR